MKPPQIFLHPNYCEEGQSLECFFQLASDLGVDGVELRRTRPDWPDTDSYLTEILRLKEKYGTQNIVFGGKDINLVDSDHVNRRSSLDEALEFYRKANEILGVRLFNIFTGYLKNQTCGENEYERHGSAVASEEVFHWQADGLKEVASLMDKIDSYFVFETHPGYVHDLPSSTMKLVEMVGSPRAGVLLDYANLLLWPNPPGFNESISLIGKKLRYIHLKNIILYDNRMFKMTSLGDGQINHRQLLRGLISTNFQGPICLEAARPGDGEWFAKQDLKYLRETLDAISF